MKVKSVGYAINIGDLEARAIAYEFNGDHLGANKLYHEAMKNEAMTLNRKRVVDRLRKAALEAYHNYEIQMAERELL